MGAPGKNFYNRAFAAQGLGDDVAAVAELWHAGKRDEAAARVPIELGFKTNLLGPADTIKERLRLYRSAGITSMQAKVSGPHRIDIVAQLIDVMNELNAEPSEMK